MSDNRIRPTAKQRPYASNDRIRELPDDLDLGLGLGWDSIKRQPRTPPPIEQEPEPDQWIDTPPGQRIAIGVLLVLAAIGVSLFLYVLARHFSASTDAPPQANPVATDAPQPRQELLAPTQEVSPSVQDMRKKLEEPLPTRKHFFLVTGEGRIVEQDAINAEDARKEAIEHFARLMPSTREYKNGDIVELSELKVVIQAHFQKQIGPIPGGVLAWFLDEQDAKSCARTAEWIAGCTGCITCSPSRKTILADRISEYDGRPRWRSALQDVSELVLRCRKLEASDISRLYVFQEVRTGLTLLHNELEISAPWGRNKEPPDELHHYLRQCYLRLYLLTDIHDGSQEPRGGIYLPMRSLPRRPGFPR